MPDLPDRNPHDPDSVAGQSFTTVRKGFEPDEVRAFLLSVASSMRDTKHRYEDMERRLVEVERRAADPKDLDVHAVTQLLGEETARVLEAARHAATDIRARAETEAAQRETEIAERDRTTREAADEYAAGVRSAADEADRRIRTDAERYAEEIRSAADVETTAQRAAADEYDDRVRTAADTEVAGLRAAATTDVERLRSEAASVLTERTAEAEVAASAILGEADGYATRVRADADRYSEATRAAADSYRGDTHASADTYKAEVLVEADRVRGEALDEAHRIRDDAEAAAAARSAASESEAQAALDAAREQGRQMVEEARTYRERVIADLADRRRTARGQLDNLAATRDALTVAISDAAGHLTASHRLLGDLEIDPTLLGDVASDRGVLEAHDSSRPALTSPSEAPGSAAADAGGDPVVGDAGAGAVDDPGSDPEGSDPSDASDATGVVQEIADEPVEAESPSDHRAEAEVVDQDEPIEAIAPSEPEPEDLPADAAADLAADAGDDPVIDLTAAAASVEEAVDHPVGDDRNGSAPGDSPDSDDAAVTNLEVATTEADIANGEGGSEGDGRHEAREGRIDQIFAKIRADRHDEPEAGANSAAGVATVGTDVLVDEVEPAADPVDADPDTDLLDRRDAALQEIEKQLARRLKRVLADEQNETLDLLRRTKGTPSADSVLPVESDHQERYLNAALEDLSTAERTGASFFGEAPERRADVADVAGEFATEILRQIRAQLIRAFEDGGDEYELGDRIRSCYREWKTQRIADTAGHFVMVAFSRGVAEGASDGDAFRWLVDDGDQPCPDCDDNRLGGSVAKGDPFPTGDLCPPAHPGCRCLAVPVR